MRYSFPNIVSNRYNGRQDGRDLSLFATSSVRTSFLKISRLSCSSTIPLRYSCNGSVFNSASVGRSPCGLDLRAYPLSQSEGGEKCRLVEG